MLRHAVAVEPKTQINSVTVTNYLVGQSRSLAELRTKAASEAKRYGLRLLPDLYAHLDPIPFEAAAQMEQDLAEDLRRVGYTVAGGH